MDQIVCDHLKIDAPAADMTEWSAMVDKVMNLKKQVKIALVGKYVELQDAYISVVEALKHSGYANDAEVKIDWVNANDVTADNVAELLSDADGIIVPGGFGQRGTMIPSASARSSATLSAVTSLALTQSILTSASFA